MKFFWNGHWMSRVGIFQSFDHCFTRSLSCEHWLCPGLIQHSHPSERHRGLSHTLPLEARDHDSPFLSIAMQPLKSYPAPLTLVTSTVYGGAKNTLFAKKHKVEPDDFIRSFLAPNFDWLKSFLVPYKQHSLGKTQNIIWKFCEKIYNNGLTILIWFKCIKYIALPILTCYY